VGEGVDWVGDLGGCEASQAGWLDGEWKPKSGAERSSVSAFYSTHNKQRLTFPEDGQTLRNTHAEMHSQAQASFYIVLQALCLASAGQQAEELMVIYGMSQAAGMPGI